MWIALALLLAAGTAAVYPALKKHIGKKYNILVVSACSLRRDRVGVFNPNSGISPKIDLWSQNAAVFTNAVSEKPWQNFNVEGNELIWAKSIVESGYRKLKNRNQRHVFTIPPARMEGADNDEWSFPDDEIHHYRESIDGLRRAVTRKGEKPFYIFTHIKYMHYPYLDRVNLKPEEFEKLHPKSRQLLETYSRVPDKYDLQLPVLGVIFNDLEFMRKKFGIGKISAMAGLISNPRRAAAWRETAGYEDDLRLITELYDLKMRRFDSLADEVLNLFGDEELQKNTVVIFTGDHGEAFMEHGVLGHSVNLYDEMLLYPLIVKIPGMNGRRSVPEQVTHRIMAALTRDLLEGRVSPEDFVEEARKRSSEYVLSRNCANTVRSVRYRGEWKFIKNLGSGKNELYNLKDDPAEKTNVIEQNLGLAWKLEEYLIDHQEQLTRSTVREQLLQVCISR